MIELYLIWNWVR